MRGVSIFALALALSAATGIKPGVAQTDEVAADEIVVIGQVSTFGATKSDIPILETARSVSIIEANKFLERGALTLDDTLAYTAGVVGDPFGFSTRGDFPFVRGLDIPEYLDNIQVLFGNNNNTRSDIYTLEQVEVLKGPASVLYGQGSPGGILNTVSKKANPDYLGRELVVDYGTFDRVQVAADLGADLTGDGKATGRLVGVWRDSGTQIDFVNDDIFVIAPSVTFQTDATRLTLLVNYTDRQSDTAHQFVPLEVSACPSDNVEVTEANICADADGRELEFSSYAGDPNFNRYDTSSFSVTAFAEQRLNDVLNFEATGRYRHSEADYQQSWVGFNFPGNPRLLTDGSALRRSWFKAPATAEQFAIDARLRARFETGPLNHELLAGVNYQDVENDRTVSNLTGLLAQPTTFNVFNPVYDGSEIPSDAAFDAVALTEFNMVESIGYYINNQITAGPIVLNAGVRFDDLQSRTETQTQDDDAVTFSVGGLYKTGFGLNPYVSYAESFEAVVGIDNVTRGPLKPSEGRQIEAGFKYQPPGTRIYATVAYFDIEQSNILDPLALPTEPSQQEGVSKIRGVEFEGQVVLGDFAFDASFSYIDTENPDGERFESIPETQGALWGVWMPSNAPLDGLRIGAGVRYAGGNISQGETLIFDVGGIIQRPYIVRTDGYVVADLLVGYDIGPVGLSLNVRNLLNTEYYGTCLARGDCFPGEQRTIVGRATLNF